MVEAKPKQEMPERIWAWNDRLQGHRFGVEETAKLPLPIDKEPVEYLRSDLALPRNKVREIISAKLDQATAINDYHTRHVLTLIYNDLFPGGVEEEKL